MADVLKQKCLRLLGHVKQQLCQLTSIWISCKLLPKGCRGEGKELRRSLCTLLAGWKISFGELVGMHMHFLIELIPCEWSHYGITVLLVYGVLYYQNQYSVIFNIFSTSYYTIWKGIKMLGQGFCTVEAWYDSGLARVLRWSCLPDLCQQWAPPRSLSDFKLTKPGCAEHKQER